MSRQLKIRATLIYLDNIFNLSSPQTHWSLGNHDIRNGNLDWIEETDDENVIFTQLIRIVCELPC